MAVNWLAIKVTIDCSSLSERVESMWVSFVCVINYQVSPDFLCLSPPEYLLWCPHLRLCSACRENEIDFITKNLISEEIWLLTHFRIPPQRKPISSKNMSEEGIWCTASPIIALYYVQNVPLLAVLVDSKFWPPLYYIGNILPNHCLNSRFILFAVKSYCIYARNQK